LRSKDFGNRPSSRNHAPRNTNTSGVADLTISKTHSGNFVQGQIGVTYTIIVTNSGVGPTSGAVNLTDTLPAGLTATAISGTGWTCTLGTLSCTRSDALAANVSYAAITVTVNVAANVPASVTNVATVSGGGELNTANDGASDPTTIGNGPDLIVTKTHSGNFTHGQIGAQYTIIVKNTGGTPTSGAVTVTDTLPAGLSATAIAGTGWICTLGTLSCTRSDALAANSSYAAITVTVNVAANSPASVTNTAVVSGGGELNSANDTANDLTTISSSLTDVSSLVRVTTTGFLFSRSSHLYTGAMTVTNTSAQPLSGPLQVVLTNLTAGVTLANATGSALGAPYITLPGVSTLNPGQSATVSLQFGNPANTLIDFTPVTFSGSF